MNSNETASVVTGNTVRVEVPARRAESVELLVGLLPNLGVTSWLDVCDVLTKCVPPCTPAEMQAASAMWTTVQHLYGNKG